MARAYVAIDGQWKAVSSPYVAVDGQWKASPAVLASVDGSWRTSHSGTPKVAAFTASKSPTAPWTRVVVNWTASGIWSQLVTTLAPVKGAPEELHVDERSGATEETAQVINLGSGKLVPDTEYEASLVHVDTLGARTVIAKARVRTDPIPMIPAMGPKGPFSHQAGGVFWEKIADADGYLCRNDNWGTQWEVGPGTPYIYYASGLAAATVYAFRAAVKIGGKYGPWTPQHKVSTHAAPYAKGTFRLTPSGASETYQSGGSQGSKWQGSSRSLWYAGNGSSWGSTRGTQRTCLFYNRDANWNKVADAVSKGGRITGARLYIHRQGSEGYNSGVPAIVALHSTSKPNAPSAYTGNRATGSFQRNTAGWINVPTDWAWHVITGRCSGIMLGNSSSGAHYMSMNKGSGLLDVDIS